MQFVEPSIFGVRSARLSFVSPTSPVRITLFPMVHIGEAEFYASTYDDAGSHDVVFLEGVNSPITYRITRSYRWLVGSRAMAGLIVQPRFPTGRTDNRIVRSDLTATEFEAEWRRVPLWLRAVVYVLAPLVGLRRRWLYSKEKLAKDMRCEDQPTLSELMALDPETGALTQVILHARDERLLEHLRAELDGAQSTPITFAIVYGAAHMRAVVRELTSSRDFFVCASDWRSILSLA